MAERFGFPLIDSHQHFVFNDQFTYYWMKGLPETLHRSYLPEELADRLRDLGVYRTVAVQAHPTVNETLVLARTAKQNRFIGAIVGSIDLMAPDIDATLELYRSEKLIRSVRHQTAEDEGAEWFLRSDVKRGLGAVESSGLACDVLCRAHQLQAVKVVAQEFPNLRFILEHAGKPPIEKGEYRTWAASISGLAKNENVCCKLSELVVQADWQNWNLEQLRPYIEHCVESFGYRRVMWGSGWPICLLASSYEQTITTTADCMPRATELEARAVFRDNAAFWYDIEM